MTETVLAKYLHTLVDVMAEVYGVDEQTLFQAAGIEPLPIRQEGARVSLTETDKLWQACEAAATDGLLGIRVGQKVSYLSYASLGHLLLTCETIGEALETAAENTAYVGAGQFDLKNDTQGVTLIYHENDPDRPAAQARVVASLLPLCRFSEFAVSGVLPEWVSLKMAVTDPAPYEQAFGCEVKAGAAYNAVYWRSELLKMPMQGANATLKKLLSKHVAGEIAASVSVAGKVRAYLEHSPAEEWSVTACSSALGLSVRTLQRKLSTEGNSFRNVVAEHTMAQACSLLKNSDKSVTEIALHLGYAEPAPFVRAFKRSVGTAPTMFRKNKPL